MLSSIELCAGAGGQALGFEQAGYSHEALVEIDSHCCNTLRFNRPRWNVVKDDLREFKNYASTFRGVDVVAGGLPCPPFSVAGKQLGQKDERNLFPDAFEIVDAIRPKAVFIENVRGFLDKVFEDYRENIRTQFNKLGYEVDWRLLQASDYGVSQLRPRVAIVALRNEIKDQFSWPEPHKVPPPSVGKLLASQMKQNGWQGAQQWALHADRIAPTIVGGSKKHGGPDLGPTRARRAWEELGVNGKTIAEHPPERDFVGHPRLTVPMVARIQGFPENWIFTGKKTNAYRQVGNAFPPPVAEAVAKEIGICLGMPALKNVA